MSGAGRALAPGERAFALRAVRRRRLFLILSAASVAVATLLGVVDAWRWWRQPDFVPGPHLVIVLLILLNARQNLRQYRYAGVLERLLPPDER